MLINFLNFGHFYINFHVTRDYVLINDLKETIYNSKFSLLKLHQNSLSLHPISRELENILVKDQFRNFLF